MERFTRILFRRKWWFLFSIFTFITLTLGGYEGLKSNYHMRYWLEKDDALITRLNYFEDNFGNDEFVVIAIHNESSVLDPQHINLLKEISHEVEKFEDVDSTRSLVNLELPVWDQKEKRLVSQKIIDSNFSESEILKRLSSMKSIENIFLSPDKKMTIIIAELKPTIINNGEVFQEIDYRTLTGQVRGLVQKFQTDSTRIYISGTPILQNDFSQVSERDLVFVMPILFSFICLVLFFLYRSVLLVIISVVVISMTNTSLYGIAGLLSFEIENMLSIVPLIVLTIMLADMVHIFNGYKGLRREGRGQFESLRSSLQSNLVPTFLTSFTTAIGFLSLAGSKLVPIANVSYLASIGVMLAWLFSVTLFPIFFSFVKDKRVYSAVELKTKILFWNKIYKFSTHSPFLIMGVFLTLSLTLGIFGLKNDVNTDPLKFFKEDAEIYKSSQVILSHLGAVSGPELIVHSGFREGILEPEFLNKVDEFGKWLKAHKYIDKTVSIVEIGKELNQKIHADNASYFTIPETREEIIDLYLKNRGEFENSLALGSRISSDMESIRLSLLWSITETRESLDRLSIIRKKAKDLGLQVEVTGKNALYLEMNDYVVETFFTSILYSVVAISLLMMFLFKSVKFGLLSMIPNLLPLSFVTGIMYFSKINLDIGTALVCAVCLGVAIDDTIHFFFQYYRERKVHSTDMSIKHVLNKVGPSLGTTSFMLCVGFGFFMLSSFVPNIKFGFLCAITILFALIADIFLLPAILLKFDKK